jgi:hypothetical protein
VIETFASKINPSLESESGKVFYSGRIAFSERSDLYVLGMNPGGDPADGAETTVREHTQFVLRKAGPLWSAYSDESWKGQPPGTFGMQPRVLHLFRQIGRDPRRTPCSNLMFIRSRRVTTLNESPSDLEELCWPFHREVISQLRPRIVVCLGDNTGKRVRQRLGAKSVIGRFVENNNRRWASRAHTNSSGVVVLSLTHPSIADWTSPLTDPSSLVLEFLKQ